MSFCLHVIAGFTHTLTHSLTHTHTHTHSLTHSLTPLTHSLTVHEHTYIHTNSPTITAPSLIYFLFPSCFSMISLSLKKLVTCGVIRSFNCLSFSHSIFSSQQCQPWSKCWPLVGEKMGATIYEAMMLPHENLLSNSSARISGITWYYGIPWS